MGEVYLALDAKLDRKVALKILPAELAANEDRMRRFVQEAKAASALNHPNIITIFEIDQTESVHFIATEFIDVQTLRERLRRESVDAEAATKALVQTEPGVVMGTALYMSPEQARGMTVDARTDIFSL